MIQANELATGDHFWALLDSKIIMMMMDKDGDFTVCGPWECPIRESDFEIIQLVDFPDGYDASKLYYQ